MVLLLHIEIDNLVQGRVLNDLTSASSSPAMESPRTNRPGATHSAHVGTPGSSHWISFLLI